MIHSQKIIFVFLFTFFAFTSFSQDVFDYRLDFFGSAGTGKYTPFWMTSNTYGMVPLQSNNGYVRGDMYRDHSFSNKIKFEAEVDVLTAAKHTSSLWIQQLYAAVSYRNMFFFIGAKEQYRSILDENLSMGDMTFSTNARPIPEINFAFPNFTDLPFTKGYIQFKADFAVGKSMDNNYILRTKTSDAIYITGILLHHKSLFFKWEDPTGRFPLSGIIGLEHAAQWAGRFSRPDIGKNPASFKDFLRVILCESGDSMADIGEQINILGNHLGTYNLKITYTNSKLQTSLYKQHYFDDNSGLEMANWRDGIWGGEITLFNQPFLQKIVVEYLQTTNQSGPMHFLFYDPILYPNARGGGCDSYYNNYIYVTGWSNFGRGIGNALLTSPEYNEDHALSFNNNRVKAFHLGLDGEITPHLFYRTLFTKMYGWGTYEYPFLKRKDNFSSLIECIYQPGKEKNWQLGLQFSFDKGDLYGNNFGCSLKLSKAGIIK